VDEISFPIQFAGVDLTHTGNAAHTYSGRKRRQEVEGGCITGKGGVDLVEWSDGSHPC